MDKLVSVLLPTYNGANRIKEAITSVINQTYTNWELLVLDDGSKDNTEQIVKEQALNDTRIKYIKNEVNLGIQKTLNKGLQESKGEYTARIDDDDIWVDADKLKVQVEFLNTNCDYVLIGTGVIVVNEASKELFRYLVPETDQEIRNKILGKNCFVHSSVLFKKDSSLKFGGYDESTATRHIEDYDLWLKLGTVGKFANLPSFGVKFTLRDGSLSSTNKLEQFKKILKLIKNFKNAYPNYIFAYIRSVARFVIYGFIFKLPIKISFSNLLKAYKNLPY